MDLNKELAGVLGIPPQYLLKYTINGCYFQQILSNKTEVSKFVNDIKSKPSKNYEYIDLIEVYPDFSSPENFVKLLELVYKYEGIMLFEDDYNDNTTFMQLFLNKVLSYYDSFSPDGLQQQAKTIDWKY